MKQVIAWMGGTRPGALATLSAEERQCVKRLFREQCMEWVTYWGEALPMDVARIFYNRARYDAHATYRGK